MRVRSHRGLAVITACAIAPVACTSLLGDYTIGSAGPTGDGGPDGLAADVIGADQVTTTDAADTGPDAAGFAKLSCVEVGSSRFLVGTVPNGGSPSQPLLFARPSQTMRMLVGNGSGLTHTYTFQTGGGGHNVQDAILNSGRVFAVKPYAGGIVALFQATLPADGGPSTEALMISKLADGSLAWSAPLVVTGPGDIDCSSRLSATFQIVDEAMDDYLLAFSYAQTPPPACAGGSPRILGRHIRGTTGTTHDWALPPSALPDDAGGSGGLDLPSDGIAVVGSDVFVMANAGGGGGPSGGGPTLLKSTLTMTSATSSTFALKVATDFMESVGIAPGLTSGTANLGFLEADISSGTGLPEMYVGQATGAALTTLNPSAALGVTTLAGLNDLIVDKSVYHWNNFATGTASENLLGIAPTLNTHIGVNFLWWDARGRVRAQHTGPTGNLLRGEFVYGADIAFNQQPFTVLADFEIAFLKDDADASATIDVWAADIACVKP